MHDILGCWTAEAIGTFVLVFPGTCAIVIDAGADGKVRHGGVALTFGLIVMAIIYSVALTFVILNVSAGAKEKGIMPGVTIGGMVAVEALFAGPISGASMSPAC